jgi:hypothetical protein
MAAGWSHLDFVSGWRLPRRFPLSLMKSITSLGILGLILGFGWFSSYAQKVVVAFNEEMVALLEESRTPFEQFWQVLGVYYEGEPVDLQALRTAHQLLTETCDRIQRDLMALDVPAYDGCAEFHQAVVEYFALNEEMVTAFGEVVEYIEDHNPVKTTEDQEFTDELINPLIIRQTAAWQEVKAQQQDLAAEYGFLLD